MWPRDFAETVGLSFKENPSFPSLAWRLFVQERILQSLRVGLMALNLWL